MSEFQTYLEFSTIHGMGHIGSSQKFSKIFWMIVVMSGFLGGGVLVLQAFDSWAKSPVSTVIETLPITQINFPKVTVCPPKDTFTNLNYDLKYDNNRTLDDKTKSHLVEVAFQLLNNPLYQESIQRFVLMSSIYIASKLLWL